MSNQAILNPVSDDISVLEGSKNELVVFGNRNDAQSFLELLKLNNQTNNRTLISLNSIENTKKFLNRFQNFEGKIFLCLNGNRSGNFATEKILAEFKNKNIKDIRLLYGISEKGYQNLSGYLQNKINFQEKNPNLVELKKSENADRTESNRLSETQHLERETPERNIGESRQNSQSEQNGNHRSGQTLGSNDAGNGLADTIEQHLVGNGGRGRLFPDVENLIEQYKGQKLTNEQVAEVVSAACFVSVDNKILLKENFKISDDLKEICSQFKSGGTAKEGRGILDEYYTDLKIVEAVRHLIKDEFKGKNEISVLEPSVGTGNFLNATKNLGIKTNTSAFEINETTAKIAKILHPETDINFRSFETEFINEKGLKTNPENYQNQYDLIIGNPPYGDHRGLYKGLGEEPKISKYEDYFVKRSLDVLKDGGTLAMVLPSGWLNRQNNLKNAEISNAFRLPVGAFSGTQIGTDIIILKKNSQKISEDISNYFENNPDKILGETKEKTNRFGRLEEYVHGSLEDALLKIEQFKNKTETEKTEKVEKIEITEKIEKVEKTEKIGNLFEDLFLENTESKTENNFQKPQNNLDENLTKIESENFINKEKKELDFTEIQEKIKQVLSNLDTVKFKSPAVLKEIEKYTKLQSQIENEPENFSQNQIEEIRKKADKIIQSQNEKSTEYRVQTKPNIQKKILKYHFIKPDEIVNTSLQNSSEISEKRIEAFRDTEYDGTLNNYGKHYEFANYIDGKWVHDFYYAEGNIYKKLEQLELDFIDKNAVGGTENQYEKQKALLENVLPKPKTLDEIFISPNHEFVHQFEIGMIEKSQWNPAKREMETYLVQGTLAEKFKSFVRELPSDSFAGSSSWEVNSLSITNRLQEAIKNEMP